MSDVEPPRIEFPCDYPVKIIGIAAEDFHEVITTIVERHAPGYLRAATTVRHSSAGNYVSITVTITATGPEQLQALFEDLKATGRVQMVL